MYREVEMDPVDFKVLHGQVSYYHWTHLCVLQQF